MNPALQNHSSTPLPRHGNAAIVLVVVLATVIASALAVALTVRDGENETSTINASMTSVQMDSVLQPVANWAAVGITDWAKAHDGALPTNANGNALIKNLKNQPIIEQATGFTATPVYRRVTAKNFEIVLPTAEVGGTAHYTYAFTADGRLLTAVPDHVFLSEDQQEQDSLKAQPSLGDDSAG